MKGFLKLIKAISGIKNWLRDPQTRTRFDGDYGQAGVTLLLAILVLSAILAISFSIATILFVEIRSSGNLMRTEPAWYGAETLKEEVLFKYKRKVPDMVYTTNTDDNKVTLTSSSSVVSDVTFQDLVLSSSNTFSNTVNRYAIYNPASSDPLGGSGYGRIRVTVLSTGNTGNLAVYLCQYDPNRPYDPEGTEPEVYTTTPCSDPTQNYDYWLVRGQPKLSTLTLPELERELNPDMQQELILVNESGGNLYVNIEGFGPSPTYVPKGIPYANETVVDINASSFGVNRRIRTYVPNVETANSWDNNTHSADFNTANANISIPDSLSLRLSKFTVEAWVYPRSTSSSWQPLVTKENSGSRNYGLYIIPNTTKIHFSFQAADCTTWRSYDSKGSILLNSWNHIAMTYDGSVFALYINGSLDNSINLVSTVCNAANPVIIGHGSGGTYSDFNGLMDEVRIWNIARSGIQISTAMGSQLTGTETGLVGYWRLNDGDGVVAVDSSAYGNNGTLLNGVSWSDNTPFP